MSKCLICGGRHFDNYNILNIVLDSILREKNLKNLEIVSGHCVGTDLLGERFAEENNLELKVFEANWTKYGKSAGPIRNKQMVDYIKEDSDSFAVAFYSKNSKGTLGTINLCKKENIPVYEIQYEFIAENYNLNEGVIWDENKNEPIFNWDVDSSEDLIKLNGIKIKKSRLNKYTYFYMYKLNKTLGNQAECKNLLKYLKNNENVGIDEMIKRTIENFYENSNIDKLDYIIKIPSHSTINDRLVNNLMNVYEPEVEIISCTKEDIKKLDFDWDYITKSFHKDYLDKFKDYLCKLRDNFKLDNNFNISKIHPRLRRYVINMLNIDLSKVNLEDENSNLLIIDDNITTGSTVSMVLNYLDKMNYKGNIFVLSLINNR